MIIRFTGVSGLGERGAVVHVNVRHASVMLIIPASRHASAGQAKIYLRATTVAAKYLTRWLNIQAEPWTGHSPRWPIRPGAAFLRILRAVIIG